MRRALSGASHALWADPLELLPTVQITNPPYRAKLGRRLPKEAHPTGCARSLGELRFFPDGFPGARGALGRPQTADGVLDLSPRELPAFPVDVEDNAVGIFELAFETVVLRLAEIKKNLPARLFNFLLLRRQVVALKTEMVDADKAFRDAGADLALVLQQCQVDFAVAHIAVPGGRAFANRRAFQPECLLVEVGGGFDVLDAKSDVTDAGCHDGDSFSLPVLPYWV